MYKIKISTDSTSDIPKALAQELNISILPLTIQVQGREYLDGVDLTPEEFYDLLERSEELPTTSQVSAARYTALYEQVWQEGYTHLIHTSINSKGSGTYQAAVISRQMFFEEHPEAAQQLTIEIIDSQTYSMIYGWGVVEGARAAQNGADPRQVIDTITEWVRNGRGMFVPMNLRFVRKSGRVSAAAAFVGDAMGLKPLITFEDGASKVMAKFRGDKRAISGLLDTVKKERKPGTPYCLVYGNNPEIYEKLKQSCEEELDQPPVLSYPVGNIISINTGPDMMAVIYRR